MDVKLKSSFSNTQPLLDYLVKSYNSKRISEDTIYQEILMQVNNIEDFDSKITFLDFDMIDFKNKKYLQNLKYYIKIVKFIYNLRQRLLKQFGQTQKSNYISKPQKRTVFLTAEAFENMGNSKLHIKENTNEYSLIFG